MVIEDGVSAKEFTRDRCPFPSKFKSTTNYSDIFMNSKGLQGKFMGTFNYNICYQYIVTVVDIPYGKMVFV